VAEGSCNTSRTEQQIEVEEKGLMGKYEQVMRGSVFALEKGPNLTRAAGKQLERRIEPSLLRVANSKMHRTRV
jgi:hypothetical protein